MSLLRDWVNQSSTRSEQQILRITKAPKSIDTKNKLNLPIFVALLLYVKAKTIEMVSGDKSPFRKRARIVLREPLYKLAGRPQNDSEHCKILTKFTEFENQ